MRSEDLAIVLKYHPTEAGVARRHAPCGIPAEGARLAAGGRGGACMANRLIHETSPYLLQHAHNPVDWYAWGPEALGRAQREDKPILLSIGYSACHWCHVMEHES